MTESMSAISALVNALIKFQSIVKPVTKDKDGHNYRYATLEKVWDTIRGPMGECGLAIVQYNNWADGNHFLITTLTHTAGETIRAKVKLELPPSKQDMQGLGTAITYARRYSLLSLLGLAPEDDDGESINEKPRAAVKSDGKYRVPFGKFRDQTLSEIGLDEAWNYMEYLTKDGGPQKPHVTKFIEMVYAYKQHLGE